MNLFIEGPGDNEHVVSCAGCNKNIFLSQAHAHQGSHWCWSCVQKGKHRGQGFGPVRFTS